jgi:hypothetical protein
MSAAMRRFVRRSLGYLFTFVAAGSALACVGSTVLWVRGYFVGDNFKYTRHRPDTQYVVASSGGRIGLAMTSTEGVIRPEARALTWGRDRPPMPIANPSTTPWGRLGFQAINDAVPIGGNAFVYVVALIAPSWFVVGITALPPGLWYLFWRRRRRVQLRRERGQCVRCGYDLRESPGRCPECGAASTQAPVHA